MNNYFQIQYRTKAEPEEWVLSSLAKNRFTSYEDACEAARALVYGQRLMVRKGRSCTLEYRVVERAYTYIENPLKVFPVQESIFV